MFWDKLRRSRWSSPFVTQPKVQQREVPTKGDAVFVARAIAPDSEDEGFPWEGKEEPDSLRRHLDILHLGARSWDIDRRYFYFPDLKPPGSISAETQPVSHLSSCWVYRAEPPGSPEEEPEEPERTPDGCPGHSQSTHPAWNTHIFTYSILRPISKRLSPPTRKDPTTQSDAFVVQIFIEMSLNTVINKCLGPKHQCSQAERSLVRSWNYHFYSKWISFLGP